MQRIGQLMAPRDPELLVDPLEVALDGANREMQVAGNLLVGVTHCGLHGVVELTGGEAHTGRDRSDRGCHRPFAAGQQSRRSLNGGGGVPDLAGAARENGGFGAGFGGVEDRTEVLEVVQHLFECLAVSGRECSGVGGAGAD